MLKGSNLTPQKPACRATQRNEKAIEDWLIDVYPKIKERAKKEQADIHWGHEMLNRNVKSNVTYSNLFTSQNDLIATLKSYLFSLQHNSSKVKSFFGFDEVFYASQ